MKNKTAQREYTIQEVKKINYNMSYSLDFIRRLERVFLNLPEPQPSNTHEYSGESALCAFSDKLVEKIKEFQNAKNLVVDGILGSKTLSSLRLEFPDLLNEPLRLIQDDRQDKRAIINGTSSETKYTFYRNVVISRFGVWKSDINEINLIGIRSMIDGIQVPNIQDEFNDTIAMVWLDENKKKHIEEFKSSIDPGVIDISGWMSSEGLAHIKDGSYYYHIGTHPSQSKYAYEQICNANNDQFSVKIEVYGQSKKTYVYEALNSERPVRVYRDKNAPYDFLFEKHYEDRESTAGGINIHFAWEQAKVGEWSQGCQVICGGKNYVKFIGLLKETENRFYIPYTVVDSTKIPSYTP